jgi:hypothetical protein
MEDPYFRFWLPIGCMAVSGALFGGRLLDTRRALPMKEAMWRGTLVVLCAHLLYTLCLLNVPFNASDFGMNLLIGLAFLCPLGLLAIGWISVPIGVLIAILLWSRTRRTAQTHTTRMEVKPA